MDYRSKYIREKGIEPNPKYVKIDGEHMNYNRYGQGNRRKNLSGRKRYIEMLEHEKRKKEALERGKSDSTAERKINREVRTPQFDERAHKRRVSYACRKNHSCSSTDASGSVLCKHRSKTDYKRRRKREDI